MSDGPSPFSLVVRWPAKVAQELLLAPWTVQRARRSLTELPDKLDALTVALSGTSQTLETLLPVIDADLAAFRDALEQVLPEISGIVGRLDTSMQHVEIVVSELGDVLLNVIGSIPGVRRALRPS